MRPWLLPLRPNVFWVLLVFFVVAGVWLAADLQRGHDKVLADTAHLARQRSQIISQSFRSQVLVSDYVLRDVLGRIQAADLVHPDPDPDHAQRMTRLLKEKADTVPDFFSMVMFNRDCVFTATVSGQNTGVKSRPALCEARRMHLGPGPLVSYVPGSQSASGRSVIVLSRHLRAPTGEFQGGVLGVVELERAQLWFDALGLDPSDSVALLDDAQVLLARQPLLPKVIEQPAVALQIPGASHPTAAGAPATAQRDLDGRERIFGFSRIDGFPFTIAYGVDKRSAVDEWRRRALVLAAGYVTLLVLALLAARSQWVTLRQREALRASETHFRLMAEDMADIVWKADAQMRFTYINAADQRVRGFARDEVVGTSLHDNLTRPDLLPEGGLAQKLDLPMRHKQGGEVWIEMSSVPIYGSDGSIIGYQGVGRDVSRRREHEASLRQSAQQLESRLLEVVDEKSAYQELATRDALTGLHNRRFLDTALPREFARAQRDHKPLAVIMLDLDHFKAVNDTHGHAAGDKVLATVAALLKKGARESDLICRYGGEEFVAIMPNMSPAQALGRVESWRRQLEAAVVVAGDARLRITLSAGIAAFPDHGSTADELLTRADEKLYQSKQQGRNRTTA